jgi:hypothetical protein
MALSRSLPGNTKTPDQMAKSRARKHAYRIRARGEINLVGKKINNKLSSIMVSYHLICVYLWKWISASANKIILQASSFFFVVHVGKDKNDCANFTLSTFM